MEEEWNTGTCVLLVMLDTKEINTSKEYVSAQSLRGCGWNELKLHLPNIKAKMYRWSIRNKSIVLYVITSE